jgi:hypothetical protein
LRFIYSVHLILIRLITTTIIVEDYKLWKSSLWNFLHLPFTSSPLS